MLSTGKSHAVLASALGSTVGCSLSGLVLQIAAKVSVWWWCVCVVCTKPFGQPSSTRIRGVLQSMVPQCVQATDPILLGMLDAML